MNKKFITVFLTLSLLLFSCPTAYEAIHHYHYICDPLILTNSTTGEKIPIIVEVDYWTMDTVFCTIKALYQKTRPILDVVIFGECRGRGIDYFDLYDGDINPVTKYRRGCRCYTISMPASFDAKLLTLHSFYRVVGRTEGYSGRLYVIKVEKKSL